MKCPQCGFENKETALYCANCGAKLEEEQAGSEKEPSDPVMPKQSDGISIMTLKQDPKPVETKEVPVHVKPQEEAQAVTPIITPQEAQIPSASSALSDKEQQKQEIHDLPRRYRPISMWGYLIYLLLLSFLPYVIGALLVKYYSGAVSGVWKTVLSISGPLLHALLLLFFSFVPRNVNVRAFARAWFIFLVIIILVLLFTGHLEQVIAFLESFPSK